MHGHPSRDVHSDLRIIQSLQHLVLTQPIGRLSLLSRVTISIEWMQLQLSWLSCVFCPPTV